MTHTGMHRRTLRQVLLIHTTIPFVATPVGMLCLLTGAILARRRRPQPVTVEAVAGTRVAVPV